MEMGYDAWKKCRECCQIGINFEVENHDNFFDDTVIMMTCPRCNHQWKEISNSSKDYRMSEHPIYKDLAYRYNDTIIDYQKNKIILTVNVSVVRIHQEFSAQSGFHRTYDIRYVPEKLYDVNDYIGFPYRQEEDLIQFAHDIVCFEPYIRQQVIKCLNEQKQRDLKSIQQLQESIESIDKLIADSKS